MDLSKIFEDENLRYYIHGTARSGYDIDNSIINSIFQNGLLTYTGSEGNGKGNLTLDSTAVSIGFGSTHLYKDFAFDALNNNRHLESKRTIIIALPKNYIFPDYYCFTNMQEAPFIEVKTFFASVEEKELYEMKMVEDVSHRVIMPEFILGAYDAITHTFIPNQKFFKNLTEKEKGELFKKVHNNYFNYLKERIRNTALNDQLGLKPFTIKDYLEIFNGKCKYKTPPLTSEEIYELELYGKKILKQKEEEINNSQQTHDDEEFIWAEL